jgi:hypothetical protein
LFLAFVMFRPTESMIIRGQCSPHRQVRGNRPAERMAIFAEVLEHPLD